MQSVRWMAYWSKPGYTCITNDYLTAGVRPVRGWRPVINLKRLNAHIFAPHFCMFTISSASSIVRKRDYTFKIDLQDVYFHVRSNQMAGSTSALHSRTKPIQYLDDWLVHLPDRQVLLCHHS